jgi:hypothetical protein
VEEQVLSIFLNFELNSLTKLYLSIKNNKSLSLSGVKKMNFISSFFKNITAPRTEIIQGREYSIKNIIPEKELEQFSNSINERNYDFYNLLAFYNENKEVMACKEYSEKLDTILRVEQLKLKIDLYLDDCIYYTSLILSRDEYFKIKNLIEKTIILKLKFQQLVDYLRFNQPELITLYLKKIN